MQKYKDYFRASPLQQLASPLLTEKKVQLFIKRDDLLHPEISGNKWRKLKYNIQQVRATQQSTILTFGGAFSNHIAATAAAGKVFDIKTVGIIRGEKILPLNPTLRFAESCGMTLKFISRTAYQHKETALFLDALRIEFGHFYHLPEGGSNELAIKGCEEIVQEVHQQLNFSPEYYCVSSGTGTTATGMIHSLEASQQLMAFSALKGNFLASAITQQLTIPANNWSLQADYHFGGYAKWKPSLVAFINQFKREFSIALDPVYTGKMMFGIFDLIAKDFFLEGTNIVAVHTGGLQGIAGFNQRFGNLLK